MATKMKPTPFKEPFTLRLPEPYFTTYEVVEAGKGSSGITRLQIRRTKPTPNSLPDGNEPPTRLHSHDLTFTEPQALKEPPVQKDNTAWGRARRSPVVQLEWTRDSAPTLAQLWLFLYAVYERWPQYEQIRLALKGWNAASARGQLCAVMLAIEHPQPDSSIADKAQEASNNGIKDELVALRSAFWQGAGSPFGPRPVWLPEVPSDTVFPLSSYPALPLLPTQTTTFPSGRVHMRHLLRPQKPRPGSTIYSRYIPHLREHFSMVVLDVDNSMHVDLYHRWQNDPRVARGWNESGSLDQHLQRLKEVNEDPHTLSVLAKFDNTYFAYFDIYWAQEDPLGAYRSFQPHDRGRHSLVGDVRFRGQHRVVAWWSAILHYIFLDEPRTMRVVGEPDATNTTVLAYDFANGFAVREWVDLPHKRSALMVCPRERFFQICPMAYDGVIRGPDGLNPLVMPSRL